MEFDIDTTFVDAIVTDESTRARAELAAGGPVHALDRSQARHDARLASAPDAATLACKSGCFWCCYFTVDVRPVEVVRIIEHLQTLSDAATQRIVAEIKTNSAVLEALDEDARVKRNLKCPFLYLGRCSIYAVRPQTCRNYHATDSTGCQQAYEEPDNEDIDPEFAPFVYQAGGAHVDAFSSILAAQGYDVRAYELNTALAVAVADPVAMRRRFETKQTTFPTLVGMDVPSEFVDSK